MRIDRELAGKQLIHCAAQRQTNPKEHLHTDLGFCTYNLSDMVGRVVYHIPPILAALGEEQSCADEESVQKPVIIK